MPANGQSIESSSKAFKVFVEITRIFKMRRNGFVPVLLALQGAITEHLGLLDGASS